MLAEVGDSVQDIGPRLGLVHEDELEIGVELIDVNALISVLEATPD